MYYVKEIFKTLQGEGCHVGRAFVFCRFTGCNLWSGREEDREGAQCSFCDTDFVGMDGERGGKYTAEGLCDVLEEVWGDVSGSVRVVFTGGEPLLQLDEELLIEAKSRGMYVAVETNGTLRVPSGVDHVCVSPKTGVEIVVRGGDELKLVYPQNIDPSVYEGLDFERFYLQPLSGSVSALELSVAYCLSHPKWRLSLQTHKVIGLP